MIKEASRDHKTEIYELWKVSNPDCDLNFLSFYFRNLYDQSKTIVQEEDCHIIGSVSINEHILNFKEKLLYVSYILGNCVLPKYKKNGCVKQLMNEMIDEASHNHLITLVRAENPKLYEAFGFQTIYLRRRYIIQREYLDEVFPIRVAYSATAKELLNAYRKFVNHFDGFYVRDLSYYEMLLKELEFGSKHLIVYKDLNEDVIGYLIYEIRNNYVVIKEAIYLESVALTRMMKAIIGDYEIISIEVSECENLEKIFPLATPRHIDYMMARINNYELLNKLFNTKAKTVEEAYSILKKPLWLHEYY